MGLGRVEVYLPSIGCKASVRKVSSERERCILGAYGLEKAYNTIDRHGMWQMLRVYGVGGKLLKKLQNLYVDSMACLLVGMDVSEWFPVNVGLKHGCVMPQSLFYVY